MEDQTMTMFNYLRQEMLLNQFSILAENIKKTLPSGHEGSQQISDQIQRLQIKRERWPEKIIKTWQERILPFFTAV